MGERTEAQQLEVLVQTAAAGDVAAQSALLAHYWPVIKRVVRARRQRLGLGRNPREDTQDAMQDVAIRLLQGLPRLAWQGSTALAAWVRCLADGQVVDAHRHHQAARRRFDAGSPVERMDAPMLADGRRVSSAESRVDRNRKLAELNDLLAEMKDEYATALMLRGAGYSHAEVGELLGCTAEAARKLESRARAVMVRKKAG